MDGGNTSSLYALNRAKAEVAHVEAELSYTRLLMSLDPIGGSATDWRHAMLHQIKEAFRDLAAAKADILPHNGPIL